MEPEEGLIWVLSLGDESVMAFTDDGVDSLVELIKITGKQSRARSADRRGRKPHRAHAGR